MSSNPLAQAPRQSSSSAWHWLSAWVPVVVCIGAIAIESTASFGADHTSDPLQRFFEMLLHRKFTQPQWWLLHIYIRKGGHFLGYGIQSLAWFRAFWMTWWVGNASGPKRLPNHLLAMLGTYLIASCDELHQTFLPNRSGSIWDVLIDCSGALVMQLLLAGWMQMRARD